MFLDVMFKYRYVAENAVKLIKFLGDTKAEISLNDIYQAFNNYFSHNDVEYELPRDTGEGGNYYKWHSSSLNDISITEDSIMKEKLSLGSETYSMERTKIYLIEMPDATIKETDMWLLAQRMFDVTVTATGNDRDKMNQIIDLFYERCVREKMYLKTKEDYYNRED